MEQAGGKWEKVMRRMDRAEQDAVAAERAAGAAAAGAAPEVKASAKGGRGRDRGRAWAVLPASPPICACV